MDAILLIFVCMIAGFWVSRLGKKSGRTQFSTGAIHAFLTYVSLPAMILVQIPRVFTSQVDGMGHGEFLPQYLWIAPTLCIALFLLSILIFGVFGKKLGLSRKRQGALILMSGLGNTSFVGFPLLEALLGHGSLSVAVLADQLGSFLPLFTVGVIVAAIYSGERPTAGVILKKLFSSAPYLALLTSLLMVVSGTALPASINQMLMRLSATLIPLGLFSVGLQLYQPELSIKKYLRPLWLSLGYKLFVGPLVAGLALALYLRSQHTFMDARLIFEIGFLEAAMGPMISASILAQEYELEPELTNLIVAIGVPISLLTVPAWYLLLHA